MEEESCGLRERESFKDEEPPSSVKSMKTRLVQKVERGADGEVERYTAHLVARGFTQRPEMDFLETFSPVVGFNTVCTVLAISAMKEWKLRALDFKQAYCIAALSEAIWLELPEGSNVKALNAIYGLKQSALEWCEGLCNAILGGGWKSSECDELMYFRPAEN